MRRLIVVPAQPELALRRLEEPDAVPCQSLKHRSRLELRWYCGKRGKSGAR